MTTELDRRPGAPPAPPNWLADAVRNVLEEARLFARTYWGITVHPVRFAEAWASGKSHALNPLAFMATVGSIHAAFLQAASLLGYTMGEDSFTKQIIDSVGPFVQYALVGAMVHVLLLRLKPRRRLLDSLGIALYAGGPALLGYVVSVVASLAMWIHVGKPDPHGHGFWSVLPDSFVALDRLVLYGIVLLFLRSLCLGLAGLHGRRWGACAVATLAVMTGLALVLGWAEVDGPFGIQVVLVRSSRATLGWSLGLRD